MRTRAFLATAAILFSGITPIAMTPALAVVTEDEQAELDAYCVDQIEAVSPGHAPFEVTAIHVVEGAFTPGGVVSSEFVAGSQHRHGGSPNIFGSFEVTTSGGSTAFTFDCQTFNPNANSEQGAYPNGLQLTGQSTSVVNEDEVVITQDGVICISPTKNPGTWRNQNGYTGTCSTALFYSLAGIPEPIPSNSLPPT